MAAFHEQGHGADMGMSAIPSPVSKPSPGGLSRGAWSGKHTTAATPWVLRSEVGNKVAWALDKGIIEALLATQVRSREPSKNVF